MRIISISYNRSKCPLWLSFKFPRSIFSTDISKSITAARTNNIIRDNGRRYRSWKIRMKFVFCEKKQQQLLYYNTRTPNVYLPRIGHVVRFAFFGLHYGRITFPRHCPPQQLFGSISGPITRLNT